MAHVSFADTITVNLPAEVLNTLVMKMAEDQLAQFSAKAQARKRAELQKKFGPMEDEDTYDYYDDRCESCGAPSYGYDVDNIFQSDLLDVLPEDIKQEVITKSNLLGCNLIITDKSKRRHIDKQWRHRRYSWRREDQAKRQAATPEDYAAVFAKRITSDWDGKVYPTMKDFNAFMRQTDALKVSGKAETFDRDYGDWPRPKKHPFSQRPQNCLSVQPKANLKISILANLGVSWNSTEEVVRSFRLVGDIEEFYEGDKHYFSLHTDCEILSVFGCLAEVRWSTQAKRIEKFSPNDSPILIPLPVLEETLFIAEGDPTNTPCLLIT